MKKENLVKNGFFNAIKTLSSIFFPLVTIPYISRTLGADNIGKLNFSNSYINYFILIASLGITTYAMRECSKVCDNKEELERTASELLSINICTMCLAYFILLASLVFTIRLLPYRTLILIYSINIAATTIGADWINMAMGDFKYITIRTVSFQLISLFLMFLLIKEANDYTLYAYITVLASSGASFINTIYRKKFCHTRFTFNLNLKKHWKSIVLLFSLLLAQSILSNLDITMLGFLTSDSEVGCYSMAVKLYTTVEKVISSIAFVLIPQLSVLFAEENYTEINKLLRTTRIFIVSFSIPFSIGLCMLSKEILLVVCGVEYTPASFSLSILSIAMFINLLGASFWGNVVLLPSGREWQFMLACFISAAINAITNYFFIPLWGINGAAITTLFSTFIILIVCKAKKDPRLYIDLQIMDLMPPIVGGLLVSLICLLCKVLVNSYEIRIVLSVLLSGICYFVILMIGKNIMIGYVISKMKEIKNR